MIVFNIISHLVSVIKNGVIVFLSHFMIFLWVCV